MVLGEGHAPAVAPVRVLIADDHELFRHGLREALGRFEGIEIVGEAATGRAAVEQSVALRPDVVLMDVRMPDQSGIEATAEILRSCPETRMLVLTMYEDKELLRQAISAGAAGYVLKDIGIETLVAGIRSVHQGDTLIGSEMARHLLTSGSAESGNAYPRSNGLTEREIKILGEVARGLGDKEIAAKLLLSEWTVKSHLRNVYRKLKVQKRAQAAAYAMQNGLVAQRDLATGMPYRPL
jgi:DNA-binding NarL/FixJ family response regulator